MIFPKGIKIDLKKASQNGDLNDLFLKKPHTIQITLWSDVVQNASQDFWKAVSVSLRPNQAKGGESHAGYK